jgi:hypothetical protein
LVQPVSQCADPSDPSACVYLNQIQTIQLAGYAFTPPAFPDDNHALLFEVAQIHSIFTGCQPYVDFSSVPGNDPITWGGSGIGGPVSPPVGFGQPSEFLTLNHVLLGSPSANYDDGVGPWPQSTTLTQLFDAIILGLPGSPYSFSFSAPTGGPSGVQWYPDFPGCDAAGDPSVPGAQFGIAMIDAVFTIYQAVP